jgi:hypothetical protein
MLRCVLSPVKSPAKSPKKQPKGILGESPLSSEKALGSPDFQFRGRFGSHQVLDTLNLSRKSINSKLLANIWLGNDVRKLLLSKNSIDTLMGLRPSDALEVLDVSGNKLLKNLLGFPKFPQLKSIAVQKTAFAQSSMHRITCILVCPTLTHIDGLKISPDEKKFANLFPRGCASLVRAGWTCTPNPPAPQEIRVIRRQLTDLLTPAERKARFESVLPDGILDADPEDLGRKDFIFLRTCQAFLNNDLQANEQETVG